MIPAFNNSSPKGLKQLASGGRKSLYFFMFCINLTISSWFRRFGFLDGLNPPKSRTFVL